MNSFGRSFRVTSFGESHGPAIGVVIDGCPAGIWLSEADIQPALERRKPGKDPLTSPRKEPDRVEILSGVFEGRTTGMPIALLIRNLDSRPSDYDELRDLYRPGHADYTYQVKYGLRDHRGGGRSSGRETAARAAAGAVAALILNEAGITVTGSIEEIHGIEDPGLFAAEIEKAKAEGDSVGGIIRVQASGCPAGLGDPVFGKLDALIAGAMMGIGGVKGVSIGDGFAAARMKGSEHNDPMDRHGFLSNHAGGILGGISTGADIVVRLAVKPTASIGLPQRTVSRTGEEAEIRVKGRHDPCIAPRVVPVAEAMLCLVLVDALFEQEKYRKFVKD